MFPIVCFFLLPLSLFAFSAKVVKISDGDTITILQNKEQTKVRLYGIDAPEKSKTTDRYKRTLGIIYYKGQDINAQMVLNGYAWAYVKYSRIYVDQEKTARENKRGLWQSNDPTRRGSGENVNFYTLLF